MSIKKSSSIWEHFTIDPAHCTVAVCNVRQSCHVAIRFRPGSEMYNPVHA